MLGFTLFVRNIDIAKGADETCREVYKLPYGMTEITMYATDEEEKNVRVHVLMIPPDADVKFKVSTGNYYQNGNGKEERVRAVEKDPLSAFGFSFVEQQVKAYENSIDTNGEVIAASNGDFFLMQHSAKGMTIGKLIAEGVVLNSSSDEYYFAVSKDGQVSIRAGNESAEDVQEAVGGEPILVWDGDIADNLESPREPRQGIGITDDSTVYILSVDGRDPSSPGISLKEFAKIFKQLGCTQALNLDGGGSSSFLTKRLGEKSLVFRNTKADGYERGVSSALLVVGDKDGKKQKSHSKIKSLVDNQTTLYEDRRGNYKYIINGIPQTGMHIINGRTFLFNENGNAVTKKIKLGRFTYNFKKGLLVDSSDINAGIITMGYCGKEGDEKSVVYAYHEGNDVFNVGINEFSYSKEGGNKAVEMKDWELNDTSQPWYSIRNKIDQIYIGEGVENVGAHFCNCMSLLLDNGDRRVMSDLTYVNLPTTIKKISDAAFLNCFKLKYICIPKNVESIGKRAFEGAGKGVIMFESDTAPEMKNDTFRESGFLNLMVYQDVKKRFEQ